MTMRSPLLPSLLLSLALNVSCWTGPRVGEQIDESVDPEHPCGVPETPGFDGGDGPRFSELMTKVFTPTCATSYCHQKDPPPVAPMTLEPDKAYKALVGAASTQVPGMRRVEPGDPSRSYLLFKLRGVPASGAASGTPVTQMPLNKPALSESTIRQIEAWIKRGAPND
jgi:hypothetical protein